MSEDLAGVLITDGRCRVFLHPPKIYGGGSGYSHQVDLVGGPFSGSINAEAWDGINAFRFLYDGLTKLHRTLSGDVRLDVGYENFVLSLKGDGMGHITVDVEAIADHYRNIRLRFGFEIDQTELPAVISSMERYFLSQSSA